MWELSVSSRGTPGLVVFLRPVPCGTYVSIPVWFAAVCFEFLFWAGFVPAHGEDDAKAGRRIDLSMPGRRFLLPSCVRFRLNLDLTGEASVRARRLADFARFDASFWQLFRCSMQSAGLAPTVGRFGLCRKDFHPTPAGSGGVGSHAEFAVFLHCALSYLGASMSRNIVRASDIGYGHIKATDGFDGNGKVACFGFPSHSTIANPDWRPIGGGVRDYDLVSVPVGDTVYHVGRDILRALRPDASASVMDNDFVLKDAYAARLFGALYYMAPHLPERRIDHLVLGLPLTTFAQHAEAVPRRFTGTHKVCTDGTEITVHNCYVYPQPLGSYVAFISENTEGFTAEDRVLVIDPGYNTLDWVVCQGMSVNRRTSMGVNMGMSQVLQAIAERMVISDYREGNVIELMKLIDRSLTTGRPLQLYGHTVELTAYLPAAADVFRQAAQQVRNSVLSAVDVRAIVLAGGGAPLYAPAIREEFTKHKVFVMDEPAFANVRGFHYLGELAGNQHG